MANGFVFDGKSTADFSMYVERYPAQNGAVRKYTTVPIPGRNGDLHIDDGAYENYTQTYECYFHGTASAPEQTHAIKNWLFASCGYCRLEDVYDPDHFRLARFVGPMDVENHLNRYGRCKVRFDCKPQCFLKTGEYPVCLTAAGTLRNPTAFTAKPLITVYGSGAGTVTVGDVTVEILDMEGSLILDCEIVDAYNADYANANSNIYAPEFPELVPGENAVDWTGGVTGVEIIPRWWTL